MWHCRWSRTERGWRLNRKVAEAESLLSYAVETGVQVDEAVVRSILEAGIASRGGWTEDAATKLLLTDATLAEMLKPVSAESLRICENYRESWRFRPWQH
jgi:hypothetical protein